MKNVNEKVAVGYCRVSTDEQAANGLSIEVQAEVCRKEMEKDGYTILEIFKDEGRSGGSLKRPGIQSIIRLVQEGKIGAVYAIHSDRIARNTLDYLTLRKLFREKGVVLKCIYQPMTDDSATSRTMDTVVASFNEMQRLITAEKVKGSLEERVRAGYFPTLPPPGYKNIENPDKNADKIAKRIIVIDPNTAPLIRELFKLYATGEFNVHDLCDIITEKGFRSRHDKKISPSRVFDLLKNRFYIGEVHWGGVSNKDGKHTPLIEKFVFEKVQQILESHNKHACRRRKYEWLLNGYLYCFRHERRYTAEWHKVKGKTEKMAYYHCTHPSGCGKYSEQIEMEEKVADKFKDLQFAPEFIEKVITKARAIFSSRRKEYDHNRQTLINRRTAAESRKRVMQDKLFDGLISDEDFSARRNEVAKELEDIDEQLGQLEVNHELKIDIAQEILLFTRDIYKAYTKAKPTVKRHYLAFFWKKFEVSDGVIIKSHPTLLFDELQKLQQVYYGDKKIENAKTTNVSKDVIISNIQSAHQDSNLGPFA